MITDEQCIKALGNPPEDTEWIILGEEGNELVCIACNKGIAAHVIENDVLSKACKLYLQRMGVKVFRNHEQVMEAFNLDASVSIESHN